MHVMKYAAELVGTFLFFTVGFIGVQAALVAQVQTLVAVPFAFGLGLLLAIYAFGHVSGGHYNPAVTVAMALDRRTTPVDAVGYIVAQIVGAVGAALLLQALFNSAAVKSVLTQPGNGFTDVKALVLETILTAGFLLVILASTKKSATVAGLAIPLTLVAIHFAAIPFTGSSVNPARSLGPALVAGDLSVIWIYIVGPVLGGIIAWALWAFVRERGSPSA